MSCFILITLVQMFLKNEIQRLNELYDKIQDVNLESFLDDMLCAADGINFSECESSQFSPS